MGGVAAAESPARVRAGSLAGLRQQVQACTRWLQPTLTTWRFQLTPSTAETLAEASLDTGSKRPPQSKAARSGTLLWLVAAAARLQAHAQTLQHRPGS